MLSFALANFKQNSSGYVEVHEFFSGYTYFNYILNVSRSMAAFKSGTSVFFVSIDGGLLTRRGRRVYALHFADISLAWRTRTRCCINYARAPPVRRRRVAAVQKKFENLICAAPGHFKSTVNRQRSYISNAYRAYAADVSAKSTAFERRAPQKLSVPVSKQLCLIKRIQWVCCATVGRTSQNNTLNCVCRRASLNVPIIT